MPITTRAMLEGVPLQEYAFDFVCAYFFRNMRLILRVPISSGICVLFCVCLFLQEYVFDFVCAYFFREYVFDFMYAYFVFHLILFSTNKGNAGGSNSSGICALFCVCLFRFMFVYRLIL